MALLAVMIGLASAEARVPVPLDHAHGLEARTVNAVALDRKGYLWVGSGEGLYRYDGYEVQSFIPEPTNPGAISDIDIRAVYEDREGVVWIGTYSNGLDRFDAQTDSFSNFRHDPADPATLADDRVNGIAEGPDGALWLATAGGLARLDRATGSLETFRRDAARADSLSTDRVNCLHFSRSDKLWIGTEDGGVDLWQPESGGFLHFDLASLTGGPPQRNAVLSLHEDRDDVLWVGTREGLVRLDHRSGQAEMALVDIDQSIPLAVHSIAADRSDRLWLATRAHGLLILEPRTGTWRPATTASDGSAGNAGMDPLTSVALASESAFVGTRGGGVYRLPIRDAGFSVVNRDNTGGLENDVISAVMATAEDGVPWVGTFGGGPKRVDVGNRTVQRMPLKRHGMRTSGVMSLAGPIDGRLYAATTHGLYEFSMDGGQVALFEHRPDNPKGVAKGDVITLLPNGDKGLWLGMGGSGLQYFDTRSQQFVSHRHDPDRPDSLSGDFITALLDEGDDRIWVGTRSNGLNLCGIENGSCRRFGVGDSAEDNLRHQHVTTLFRDRRGRVWVGTDGGGLHLVLTGTDGNVTGFRNWDRDDGLLNNRIMAIQEDLDESLWLSTREGLSRFNPATGDAFNYVAGAGLPVSHFNDNASASDGRYLYFGSTDGLLSIPKGSLLPRREPADVRIASVTYTIEGERQRATTWPAEGLELPFQDEISIELSVLDFEESGKTHAYRLQSTDPWTELGPDRQVIIRGLDPGRYELQARGRNAYGISGESDPLPLSIVPPFWMTVWFRALLVALVAALAWSLHLARSAVLKRRADEMLRLGAAREKALEERLGPEAELAVLTPRQKEILQLIAEGTTTRDIAERLGLSIKTVESHRANLMERLDIHDVPGLVRLAIRSRLVPLRR